MSVKNQILVIPQGTGGGGGGLNPNLAIPVIVDTPTNYPVFNIGATTDNGGTPIVYSSSDILKATVDSSGNVTLIGLVGNVTITATQASGGGYSSASVSRTFTINDPLLIDVVTEASITPSVVVKTISDRNNCLAIYVGSNPNPLAKNGAITPVFNLYVKINATIHTIEVHWMKKIFLNVLPTDTIAIGTTVASDIQICELYSESIAVTSLRTITGTNISINSDKVSVGKFTPSTAHITFPYNKKIAKFISNGTSKYWISYREFDGTNWSEQQYLTIPKNSDLTVEFTCRKVQFGTFNGDLISVNVDASTSIDRVVSEECRFVLPVVTGTSHLCYSNSDVTTACNIAVAGDEIVLMFSGSPYIGIEINAPDFLANIALGNKGSEGIMIRGQVVGGVAPTVQPTQRINEDSGSIQIRNGGATQYSYIKDLVIDSTTGGQLLVFGGLWNIINITGGGVDTIHSSDDLIGASVGNSPALLLVNYFDCHIADGYSDIWNFNGNNTAPGIPFTTASIVEMHACSGRRSGAFANSQCMTTHAELDIFCFGCDFEDAFLDAIGHETTNNSISWHAFNRISRGTRKCGVYQANLYDCIYENTAGMGNTKGSNPYFFNTTIKYIVGAATYGNFRSNTVCKVESNIFENIGVNTLGVFYSGVAANKEISKGCLFTGFNASAAVQVSNYGGVTLNDVFVIGNTFVGNTVAMSGFDAFNTMKFGNNACKTNGTSVNSLVAPNNKSVSIGHNIIDPTVNVNVITVGTDVTVTDASIDSTYRPTASGNADNGTGDNALYAGIIGRRDPDQKIQIMAQSLTPIGAFARLAYNAGAVIVPESY